MRRNKKLAWIALLSLGLGHPAFGLDAKNVPLGSHYQALFEVGRLWIYDFTSEVVAGGGLNYAPHWIAWCTTTEVRREKEKLIATWVCDTTGDGFDATTDISGKWSATQKGLVDGGWWGDYPTVIEGFLLPRDPKRGYFFGTGGDDKDLVSGSVRRLGNGDVEIDCHLASGNESRQTLLFGKGIGPTSFSYAGGDDSMDHKLNAHLVLSLPAGPWAQGLRLLLNWLPKLHPPLVDSPEDL